MVSAPDCLILATYGAKSLHLAERMQVVADDLGVGAVARQAFLEELGDLLAVRVVLVDQVDLRDLGLVLHEGGQRGHLHRRVGVEAEVREACTSRWSRPGRPPHSSCRRFPCPDCARCAWRRRRRAARRRSSRCPASRSGMPWSAADLSRFSASCGELLLSMPTISNLTPAGFLAPEKCSATSCQVRSWFWPTLANGPERPSIMAILTVSPFWAKAPVGGCRHEAGGHELECELHRKRSPGRADFEGRRAYKFCRANP